MPILTIAIPTRNRAPYLRELLASLTRQIKDPSVVAVHVFDNASEDATEWTVRGAFPRVNYHRSERNIGPHANQELCATVAGGDTWTWVLCDDDLIADCAVERILECIYAHSPALIQTNLGLDKPIATSQFRGFYQQARQFLWDAARYSPRYLNGVGGWSQCVFRGDLFCQEHFTLALKRGWSYPHVAALWSGMQHAFGEHGGPVAFIRTQLVFVREAILPPADGIVPSDSSDENWKRVIEFLNERFALNTPTDVLSKVYSDDHVRDLLRNPWAALKKYWSLMLIPRNWPRAIRRLWHYSV